MERSPHSGPRAHWVRAAFFFREGTLWRAILGRPPRARRIGLTGLVGLGLRGRREQPDGVDGDVVEPRQLLGQRRRDTRARTAPEPDTTTNASASDGC